MADGSINMRVRTTQRLPQCGVDVVAEARAKEAQKSKLAAAAADAGAAVATDQVVRQQDAEAGMNQARAELVAEDSGEGSTSGHPKRGPKAALQAPRKKKLVQRMVGWLLPGA